MSEDVELQIVEGTDRRRFVGGSETAAILGLAPEINGRRKTALDIYLSKIREDGAPDPDPLTPADRKFLERRKRWEPVVVGFLKEEMDVEILHTNRRLWHPSCPFMAAEIDVEVRDEGEPEPINVEIKSVSPRAWGERFGWGTPGTEDCPIHYWIQVQHGLAVTNRKRAVLAAMVGLDDILLYPIARAETDIVSMREAVYKFWNENVLKRVPPEPMTIADLSKLFRAPKEGLAVEANSDLGSKALQLRAIMATIEANKLQQEALEFEVKLGMGEAEKLLVDGNPVFSWKQQNWSRLDQSALKEEQPKIHKAFTRSGKHRVFSYMTTKYRSES